MIYSIQVYSEFNQVMSLLSRKQQLNEITWQDNTQLRSERFKRDLIKKQHIFPSLDKATPMSKDSYAAMARLI